MTPQLLPHRAASLVVALVLLTTACSSKQAELEALQLSSDEAVEVLEGELTERDTKISELEGALEEALEAAETDVSTLEADLGSAVESVASLELELDTALAEVDEVTAREQDLLNTYDVQIRADAQAAWDAEVVAACAAAGEGVGPINSYVTHTDQLANIGPRSDLTDAVTACAQPLRDRSEDEKLAAECTTGDPDALLRGTDDFVGDCLVVYVIPFQWDSRTGDCSFLAHWDGTNRGTSGWRYDGDGLFQAGASVCAEELDGADQDDLLQIWVNVAGTYAYDTAAGGTNAVPQFEILKAVLVSKA